MSRNIFGPKVVQVHLFDMFAQTNLRSTPYSVHPTDLNRLLIILPSLLRTADLLLTRCESLTWEDELKTSRHARISGVGLHHRVPGGLFASTLNSDGLNFDPEKSMVLRCKAKKGGSSDLRARCAVLNPIKRSQAMLPPASSNHMVLQAGMSSKWRRLPRIVHF